MEKPNFRFFLLDTLSASNHTLVINVTECLNHTFIFDYITYTPSFSSLASMPTLVFTAPPTASAGSGHAQVGAIVGGVVGGLLALLVYMALMVFWLRRRKAKKNLNLPSEERPESVSPFHLSAFLMELYSLSSGS